MRRILPPLCVPLLLLVFILSPSQTPADPASYTSAAQEINAWMTTLTPEKQDVAEHILREHTPRIQSIQRMIHQKLLDLRALRYDTDLSPETLPRLGLELQTLRGSLQRAYQELSDELTDRVGSSPIPSADPGKKRSSSFPRIPGSRPGTIRH